MRTSFSNGTGRSGTSRSATRVAVVSSTVVEASAGLSSALPAKRTTMRFSPGGPSAARGSSASAPPFSPVVTSPTA